MTTKISVQKDVGGLAGTALPLQKNVILRYGSTWNEKEWTISRDLLSYWLSSEFHFVVSFHIVNGFIKIRLIVNWKKMEYNINIV